MGRGKTEGEELCWVNWDTLKKGWKAFGDVTCFSAWFCPIALG